MTATEQQAGDRYLIRKRGAFYRPNAEGYTNNRGEAGRYTLAQAVWHSHPNGPNGPRDGIDYVLADEPAAPCLASVSSTSAEPRKDTIAFVQDWLMNADYDPTQFDKDFAAAIDARHGFDDAALTAIAERFCAAPLPDTVCADLVAIKPMAGRSGTNLMTVAESKAVLRSIFPEPVPATNQAGEVPTDWERALIAHALPVLQRFCPEALATQPATSQEGEALAMARRCQQARHSAVEPVERDNVLHEAATLLRRLAATPTPPTLSEDLREAIEGVIEHVEVRIQDGKEIGSTVWRLALEDVARDLRASLTTSPARSYADAIADAAKVADDYALGALEGGEPLIEATAETIAAAIRLLSQGGKA